MFTWGSDEAMAALVSAQREEPYGFEVSFNSDDFEALVYALREYAEEDEDPRRQRAWYLLSDIAVSYGMEWV